MKMFYNTISRKIEKLEEIFTFNKVENSKALIAIPHGGCHIPQTILSFLDYENNLFPLEIDQSVNEIYGIPDFSFARTSVHRHVVNLNKQKYKSGELNIFREVGFNGERLYNSELPKSTRTKLTKTYYDPFFKFIKDELNRIREDNGDAFLLNAHSMEADIPKVNLDLENSKRPDFCLGTNFMQSIDSKVLSKFYSSLHSNTTSYFGSNISIDIDDPFVGRVGLTKAFGQPKKGLNALLLEINQNLYFSNMKSDQIVVKALNNIVKKTLEDII